MTEHLIRTQHGLVAVVDYGGDGPDLILLHGAGRNLGDWGLVRPHLMARRVVAVDFRWHGHSSDEGDVGVEANADDVEVVVADLGLRNPVVAGHSLGGMVAVVYGARHPECPGVVNIDGHGLGAREDLAGVTDEQYEEFLNRVGARSGQPQVGSGDDVWREAVITGWQQIASASNWSFPPEAAGEINARSFKRDSEGLWHLRPNPGYQDLLAASLGSLRLLETYRRCQCPLLIYHCRTSVGTGDALVDEVLGMRAGAVANELRAVAEERANIRVKTVNTSHFPIFDMPLQIAEDILGIDPAARSPLSFSP